MACKANVDMVLTPDVSKDPVKWTMENCVTKVKGGYGGYPPPPPYGPYYAYPAYGYPAYAYPYPYVGFYYGRGWGHRGWWR